MNIFLINPSEETFIQLSEEESAHCVRVLRHKSGDEISMVDGVGGFYKGKIIHADARECTVNVLERAKDFGKRNYNLHIAVAPTKNIDRFEWFIEKATEIGIDEITPLICEHSERREVKIERLNKVIVAAMKQSIKAYLPKLNEALSFKDFVSIQSSSNKFICSCEVGKDVLLKNLYHRNSDVVILVGPEGDFSKEETEAAKKSDFKMVSLGGSRLRTETAGVIACNTIQLINQ